MNGESVTSTPISSTLIPTHTQLSSKSREIFMECPDSEASCFSSSKMVVRNKSEEGLILVDEIMNIQ